MKLGDLFKKEADPWKILQDSVFRRCVYTMLGGGLEANRRYALALYAADHLQATERLTAEYARKVNRVLRGPERNLLSACEIGPVQWSVARGWLAQELERITGTPCTQEPRMDGAKLRRPTDEEILRIIS